MAKIFEAQTINSILTGYIEEFTSKGNLVSSKPFELATHPIEEYEGRMRVTATDKFDVAVFIAAVNFYLNKSDLQARRNAKGAMIFYMDTEVSDKIFKAAGMQVPYDEDDESMMGLCGKLTGMVAASLKDGLSAKGFAGLELSEPEVFKNTISHGVEFSKDQDEKQEIAFFFLKHKAIAIDWTMGPIPRK